LFFRFLHKDTISKCLVFSGAPDSFLLAVTTQLKFCVCLPDDYVFREEEEGDSIYFLRKGQMEVSSEESGPLAVLEEGKNN